MAGKRDDSDTEWFNQQVITERTGCSASWVHGKGAEGTIRRREAGKWHGRPKYEYAYADVIREADDAKVKEHRRAQAGEATRPPCMPMSAVLPPVLPTIEYRIAPDLDGYVAWLRDGLRLAHITSDQARAMLAEKVKL